ncbi:MAG: hypothetical protein GY810_00510 [Aureispira sp.]|nr:hypothetical protein [Aureispira sp.]
MSPKPLDDELAKQVKTTWTTKKLYVFHFSWILILWLIFYWLLRKNWSNFIENSIYGTWWLAMGAELIVWNYMRFKQALKPCLIASLLTAVLTAILFFATVYISFPIIDSSSVTLDQLGNVLFLLFSILALFYGAITIGVAHLVEKRIHSKTNS